MKKPSIFRQMDTFLVPNRPGVVKTKKVRFIEEGLDYAKK